MIVLLLLTLSQWICINKGFWIFNIWKVTQYCVILPRLRCKHRKKSDKSQNTISFRGVFSPSSHIYKPLIENPGITWIPIYFYWQDGKFLPIIVDGDFVNSTWEQKLWHLPFKGRGCRSAHSQQTRLRIWMSIIVCISNRSRINNLHWLLGSRAVGFHCS